MSEPGVNTAPTNPAPTNPAPAPNGPLAALAGTFAGAGDGEYPTIADFRYNERSTFTWSPKGFFVYQQTTSHPESGLPMHAETGYLRVIDGSTSIELVLVQPSGVVEVHAGVCSVDTDGTLLLNLQPTNIATSPAAKSVTDVRRSVRLKGDTLTYDIAMAAVGLPLQHHLKATLRRIPQ